MQRGGLTHRPLESTEQGSHDGHGEDLLSELSEDLGGKDLEGVSGVSHHVGLPED